MVFETSCPLSVELPQCMLSNHSKMCDDSVLAGSFPQNRKVHIMRKQPVENGVGTWEGAAYWYFVGVLRGRQQELR